MVTDAAITYSALAKGRIHATAALPRSADDLLGEVDAQGRVSFEVPVELHDDDGTLVARMTVTWLLSRP